MSAPCCVMYYGLRFHIDEEEIEAYEERVHPVINNARKYRLQYFWGNFARPDEKYYALVGSELGVFGVENKLEYSITNEAFNKMIEETDQKIKRAGYTDKPALYIQWMED